MLRNGESQRADGRYAYKYTDKEGTVRFIYSWKLESGDKLPKGKRDCESLRDKIRSRQKDIHDEIVPLGGKMTVLELVEKYILQKTGLRISEFVGVTITDIDLKNNKLTVDHQLQRTSNMKYAIVDTKTSSGCRNIPLTEDVAQCFRKIISNRKKPRVEPMVDGRCGFLFLDKNDKPMVALHWEKYMQHIREKYNKIYRVPMPRITPHVCRHTYCSNMARSGMNPKTLQYLMGHSDIGVTLNTYTHFKYEDAADEVARMNKNNAELFGELLLN